MKMKNEPCCKTCKYHDGVCKNEDVVMQARSIMSGALSCQFFSFCSPREWCCNYYEEREKGNG